MDKIEIRLCKNHEEAEFIMNKIKEANKFSILSGRTAEYIATAIKEGSTIKTELLVAVINDNIIGGILVTPSVHEGKVFMDTLGIHIDEEYDHNEIVELSKGFIRNLQETDFLFMILLYDSAL